MNELRRMVYLNALGVDSYISRAQLPGAALTRRLAIVPSTVRTADANSPLHGRNTSETDIVTPAKPVAGAPQAGIALADFGLGARARSAVDEPPREPPQKSGESVPRFSLSIIAAGDWLWLEERDGMSLTTAQVQLVQAMAQALTLSSASGSASHGSAVGVQTAKPVIAQFDWPMHNNPQLDQGEDAARTSVAAFVSRKLQEHACRGLVLLGQSCVQRVPLAEVATVAVCTASSADILANPAIKPQVWRDLQPLRGRA